MIELAPEISRDSIGSWKMDSTRFGFGGGAMFVFSQAPTLPEARYVPTKTHYFNATVFMWVSMCTFAVSSLSLPVGISESCPAPST